eukprot:COSAG05_NODE_13112_length_441_cov_1.125731_1_plen_42_part_10
MPVNILSIPVRMHAYWFGAVGPVCTIPQVGIDQELQIVEIVG